MTLKRTKGNPPKRWPHIVSPVIDLFYGTLPTPTFQLPNGQLQPDFLMDTFPDAVFFIISFAIVGGLAWAVKEDMNMLFAIVIPVTIHWLLYFGHGLPKRSEKYFDLAGQLGFSALLTFSAFQRSAGSNRNRSNIICLLACIWSFRLGYFLFTRMLERGEDWRFVKARNYPGFHFFTWTSQGVWCYLQAQAILCLHHKSSLDHPEPLGTPSDYAGLIIWAVGLIIETTADLQKLDYVRRNPDRATRKWIDEGLWSYSKHPNFFGETLVWVGLSLFCLSGVASTTEELARLLFAPVFSATFLMQTTVPWLDILAREKYRNDEAYSKYSREVSSYVPLPRRPEWI